ncbi:MAG: hypothetical protein Q8R63_09190 [Ramlibacter sp.]|nr:hypothetical protein [Ramlibacter sp.]
MINPQQPRVAAHAASALSQEERRGSNRGPLTLLDFVDRSSTDLLTYELRSLLRRPDRQALWGNGALSHAARLGNVEAVQFYMHFIGRDLQLPDADKQELLCGRTRLDQGMSLLHQATVGFGLDKPLTREQQFSVGAYLSTLLALPVSERFRLEVIGELHAGAGHGEQTSARIAMQRGELGLVVAMMGAILDARSTPQERSVRLEALGVTPGELLAALKASGNFAGSLMRLEASVARAGVGRPA